MRASASCFVNCCEDVGDSEGQKPASGTARKSQQTVDRDPWQSCKKLFVLTVSFRLIKNALSEHITGITLFEGTYHSKADYFDFFRNE